MRRIAQTLMMAALLTGCDAVRQPRKSALPAPPQPPAPAPAPLVFPQFTVKAPVAQPVPPEAIPHRPASGLAMAPEPEHPVATPAQSHVNMPTPPSVAGPVPTSPEVQAPSLPPSREPANLQSRTDRARNRAAIEAKIRQVRGMLASLGSRNLPRSARDDRDRVASLVELAQQALAQGNLRQADDLSGRAAMLAKTLTDAK